MKHEPCADHPDCPFHVRVAGAVEREDNTVSTLRIRHLRRLIAGVETRNGRPEDMSYLHGTRECLRSKGKFHHAGRQPREWRLPSPNNEPSPIDLWPVFHVVSTGLVILPAGGRAGVGSVATSSGGSWGAGKG